VKLSEVSVRRPVFATVVALLLVILGLLAATRLPIRELPDVESPVVSIETTYRGASADVVETKITQVIEERVAGLEGVTKITSESVDGRSSINLEFAPDRPVDEAANDVRDRVSRVAAQLPVEADPPEIGKVDFAAQPIIYVNLSSDTLNVLELTVRRTVLVERLGVLPASLASAWGARRCRAGLDRSRGTRGGNSVIDVENALRRERALPLGVSVLGAIRCAPRPGQLEQDFRSSWSVAARTATSCGARGADVACGREQHSLSRSNGVQHQPRHQADLKRTRSIGGRSAPNSRLRPT
jgi:multidrug efflux pump